MAKSRKKTTVEAQDDSILDVLGLGGDPAVPEPKKGAEAPADNDARIAALVGTIEGLNSRVDQMHGDFTRALTGGAAAITTPDAPQLKELTTEGLPDATDDPEGFAKGLNTRMTETLQSNMAALTAHQAAEQAAATATGARGDRLWSDFQESYFDKLETDLPDTISDVTPYVETAAKTVATKAVRGIADPAQKARVLDSLMYGTPQRFMEDVFAETDRVLGPLRVKAEGEDGEVGPTPEEVAAHRTSGITGAGGGKPAKPTDEDAEAAKSTLVGDIQEIQRATGFF